MVEMRKFPNWFEGYAQQYFEHYLLQFAGQPNLRYLQIGAYCGDASVWLCDNVLTDPSSFLTDVDTWAGSNEEAHESIDFEEVRQYYMSRIDRHKVSICPTYSDIFFLRHMVRDEEDFDFIYIDGSHETEQVLRDAVNAEQCLKSGGIIAFDDYYWRYGNDSNIPYYAINSFMRCYQNKFEILDVGLQVWLQKK